MSEQLDAHLAAEALADDSNRLNIHAMTLEEFLALPYRGSYNSKEEPFSSIVILPMAEMHDSGYRCMDFIGVRDNFPVCRLSGCSDVLHINGIGGKGSRWEETVPRVHAWTIDCLPKSGLLRLWDDTGTLSVDSATLSSFVIYVNPRLVAT